MTVLPTLSALQWSLLAMVPAGVLALYFLRLRRKPLQVPSTLLWKRSIEDLRVNSLWQRLRRNLLLFLQLLLLGLLIAALLRPGLRSSIAQRRMILLIDNSASMSAIDVAPSRLEVAKQRALELVDQMEPSDAALVIAFHDSARVVSSFSHNAQELRRAIGTIAPSDRATDPREAFRIAGAMARPANATDVESPKAPATVYLFSDGQFPAFDEPLAQRLDLRYVPIGATPRNVAVIGLSANRPKPTADRRPVEIFARARNYQDEPAQVVAELRIDGQTVDLQRLDLPPGQDQAMTFRLADLPHGVVEVALDVEDDLKQDNQAWMVIQPDRRIRVARIGPENPVLDAALRTETMARIADIQSMPAEWIEGDLANDPQASTFDAMIFDRCAPVTMPDCNCLFIDAVPPSLAGLARRSVTNPTILNWNAAHPLLRHIGLAEVNVVEAFTLKLPAAAQSLIDTDSGSLLFAVPRGLRTDFVQTFAFVDDQGRWRTDWPLKLSFPLYVYNLIRVLEGSDQQWRSAFRVGEVVTIRLDNGTNAASATLRTPDGQSTPLAIGPRRELEVTNTDQVGLYEVVVGDRSEQFAVNLFNQEESDLGPAESVQSGTKEATVAAETLASRRELWKWLVGAVLALALLEWYIYNRRVYI